MKISVIIPVFNRASLISETLDSILKQSRPADEIIVVDDMSTDHLQEVLKEYGDKIIVLSGKGLGPGAARNIGLQAATGDVIQFFDSDDIMSVNKLEVQVSILESNLQADVVYGPYIAARQLNERWEPLDGIMQYYPLANRPLTHMILEGWCAITQSCLFRRRLIDNIGPWREDLMTHEDKEYWYRIALSTTRLVHERQSLTLYRQHEHQITNKSLTNIERTLNGRKVFVELLQLAEKNDIPWISKALLKGLIVNYEKYANQHGHQFPISLTDKWYYILSRVYSKIGRMRSGSDWQPMHGVNSDTEAWEKYVTLF